jgi:hypothetical protein
MSYKHISIVAKAQPLEKILDAASETSKAIAREVALAQAAPALVEALQALVWNIDVSTINNSQRSSARWTVLKDRANAVLATVPA